MKESSLRKYAEKVGRNQKDNIVRGSRQRKQCRKYAKKSIRERSMRKQLEKVKKRNQRASTEKK